MTACLVHFDPLLTFDASILGPAYALQTILICIGQASEDDPNGMAFQRVHACSTTARHTPEYTVTAQERVLRHCIGDPVPRPAPEPLLLVYVLHIQIVVGAASSYPVTSLAACQSRIATNTSSCWWCAMSSRGLRSYPVAASYILNGSNALVTTPKEVGSDREHDNDHVHQNVPIHRGCSRFWS